VMKGKGIKVHEAERSPSALGYLRLFQVGGNWNVHLPMSMSIARRT
jgi:hypothetical protein